MICLNRLILLYFFVNRQGKLNIYMDMPLIMVFLFLDCYIVHVKIKKNQ